MSDELVEGLKRIEAILALAFANEIAAAKRRVRADPVAAELLDAAEDWTPSGNLQAHVAKVTGKSTRTVRTQIAQLISLGALSCQGPANAVQYKATGLI